MWPVRKTKSKRERDAKSSRKSPGASEPPDACDCQVVDAVTQTLEEIGDAVSYYFLRPSKLSHDIACSSDIEDLIFPVSTGDVDYAQI